MSEALDNYGNIIPLVNQAGDCVLIPSQPLFQLLKDETQIRLDVFTDLNLGLTSPFQEVRPLWATQR